MLFTFQFLYTTWQNNVKEEGSFGVTGYAQSGCGFREHGGARDSGKQNVTKLSVLLCNKERAQNKNKVSENKEVRNKANAQLNATRDAFLSARFCFLKGSPSPSDDICCHTSLYAFISYPNLSKLIIQVRNQTLFWHHVLDKVTHRITSALLKTQFENKKIFERKCLVLSTQEKHF